ncbi:MAG: hypothetical protein HRU35_02930 [Rickettsiaceae bacterium]|nr:hypothetical protein [Rickettsiaceae bacterium]
MSKKNKNNPTKQPTQNLEPGQPGYHYINDPNAPIFNGASKNDIDSIVQNLKNNATLNTQQTTTIDNSNNVTTNNIENITTPQQSNIVNTPSYIIPTNITDPLAIQILNHAKIQADYNKLLQEHYYNKQIYKMSYIGLDGKIYSNINNNYDQNIQNLYYLQQLQDYLYVNYYRGLDGKIYYYNNQQLSEQGNNQQQQIMDCCNGYTTIDVYQNQDKQTLSGGTPGYYDNGDGTN